jgi:uncharacterized protein YqeY
MKISEQINEGIKNAMRSKDKVVLEALRAAKTAFTLAKTQEGAGGEITDNEEIRIIQKLVKQRKESADIYKSQSRDDLYKKEIAEAEALEKYLPVQMNIDELQNYLSDLIKKTGATGLKDMGKVMGIASKELAGKADGKEIASIVRSLLQN